MNIAIMSGRLGRDPESRTFNRNGTESMMATFTLAVDRGYSKNNERVTDWFNCSVFGKTAEHVMAYYHKGMKAICIGKVELDKGTDKNGNPTTYCNFRVNQIEFGESKSANEAHASAASSVTPTVEPIDTFQSIPDIMEELPFN